MRIEYLLPKWVHYFYNVRDFPHRIPYWGTSILFEKLSAFYDKVLISLKRLMGFLRACHVDL